MAIFSKVLNEEIDETIYVESVTAKYIKRLSTISGRKVEVGQTNYAHTSDREDVKNTLSEMHTKLGSEAPELEFKFLTSQEYFSQLLYVVGMVGQHEPKKREPKYWHGYKRRELSGHDLIDLLRKQKIKIATSGSDRKEGYHYIVNPKFCPNLYTDEIMIHFDHIGEMSRTGFYENNIGQLGNHHTRALVKHYCPEIGEDILNTRYGDPTVW